MPETTSEKNTTLHFYTETIEISGLSAHAFFEAGDETYKGKRFYWQNKEKTFTLVGLGHAYTLTNDLRKEDRYKDISRKWKELCSQSLREKADIQPVLFGGFSFDPDNQLSSEWDSFPSSFFAVATFQLIIKNDQAFVSIHYITDETESSYKFDQLRKERDILIHRAQVYELKAHKRPSIVEREDRLKDEYLQAVERVTNRIRNNEVNKVVIGRSLRLTFDAPFSSSTAIYNAAKEQPESYLFGLENDEKVFVGATPERLVKLEQGIVQSAGLAGSIRRGKDAEEDRVLGETLLSDSKNLKEHNYVVQMI